MSSTIMGKLLIQIAGNTVELNKALAQAGTSLSTFQKTVSTTNQLLAGLGIGIGFQQLKEGFLGAVKLAGGFEHTMSEVKAITGTTGKEFDALRDDALRLGAATKFTSEEVGKLQVAYGRLGFSPQEIVDATEATLDLAAATGEDLAKAADVAGSTVRGFGLDAKETQRVVDVMAASFNRTALGLDNFAEAMKYVAPVAKQAGLSVEQTTALLGTLADAGIRGSSAGTALRKIITDLGTESGDLSERIGKLAAKGLTGASALDEVGRTAYSALLILAEAQKKTDGLAEGLKHVTGEAKAMGRVMQDDLRGDVEKFSSAWEGMIITITKTQPLRDFVQQATAALDILQGKTEGVDQVFKKIAYTLTNGFKNNDLSAFSKEDLRGNLQQYIDKLTEIRKETGKPIDLRYIEEIAEKYNLSSKGVQFLREAIEKANMAMSFQEQAQKQFKTFAEKNGFKDLKLAADEYIKSLDKLIIAETNKQQKLKQDKISLKVPDGGFLDADIKKIDDQIAAYQRVIAIIKQTSDAANGKGSGGNVKKGLGLIEQLEKDINDFEAAKKSAFSVDDITNFNAKIKDLRDQLDLLNSNTGLSTFGKEVFDQPENATKVKSFEFDFKDITPFAQAFPTEIPAPDTDKYIAALKVVTDATVAAGVTGVQSINQQIMAHDMLIQKQLDQANVAQQMGNVIGDAFAQAATGQLTFAQAAQRATVGIVKTFAERALAGIIASAATTGGPPPIAIALAAAGVAAIGAMFASIGAKSRAVAGGGGGLSSSASSSANRFTKDTAGVQITLTGDFKLRGRELALAIDQVNRDKQITG